jgi:hypothetical protein
MGRKSYLFLLAIITTSLLFPIVYAATVEGVIGSYDFVYDPSQSTPSAEYTFNVPYDGLLDLWTESTTQDWAPPLLYIETQNGWILFQSISIPIYSQGDSLHLLLRASTLDHQAGSLYYRLNYDGGNTTGHLLEADFTVEPNNPTISDYVTVNDNSRVEGASITSYEWSINGEPKPMYNGYTSINLGYQVAGTYVIQLTVEDDLGYTDTYTHSYTVTEETWTLVDTETCISVEQTAPYNPINPKTEFSPEEDITAWVSLANITGAHTVDIYWSDPDYVEVKHSTIIIPDPASQGYTNWLEYKVWDTVYVGDVEHTELLQKPGTLTVTIYVDNIHVASLSPSFSSALDITVDADKELYITGESVVLTGRLTYGGQPVTSATIIPVVYRTQNLLETISSIETNQNGEYTITYTIPKVEFTTDISVREDWSISLTASPHNPLYGVTSENVGIRVYPVQPMLDDLTLVQVIEVPSFSTFEGPIPYIAANRDAGVRLMVSCPGLPADATVPKITVRFSYMEIFSSVEISEEREIELDSAPAAMDFFFKLSPGRYVLHWEVDSDSTYIDRVKMSQDYIASLKQDISVISKKMEPLQIRFVPIDLAPIENGRTAIFSDPKYSQVFKEYLEFCKIQSDFIKQVYPIPEQDIKVSVDHFLHATPIEALSTLTRQGKLFETIEWLTAQNLLWYNPETQQLDVFDGKYVGVTPQSEDWWEGPKTKDQQGISTWITYAPPIYQTSAVLVMMNAEPGVTAHEIGHTVGLNRWIEEYSVAGQELGIKYFGLVQKGQNIYDLRDDEEKKQFSGMVGTGDYVCFMGSNPGYPSLAWICSETYPLLFKRVMDPPPLRTLFVSGMYTGLEGFVLNPSYTGFGLSTRSEEGIYSIESVSSSGKTLNVTCFGGDVDELRFSLTVPYPSEATLFRFKRNNETLLILEPTPNPPVINTLDASIVSDELLVSWSVNDADDDTIYSTLLYSNDNGDTWTGIDAGLTTQSLSIPAGALPGGDTCMIRLVSTDGINTAQKTSNPFTTVDKAPTTIITTDLSNTTETHIILDGFAYDLEEGYLSGDRLTWVSDLDGSLGGGENLNVSLSSGVHTITLEAEDSVGNKASDTFTLKIGVDETRTPVLVYETLCKAIDYQSNPIDEGTSFNVNESIISYLVFNHTATGDTITWEVITPAGETENWFYVVESDEYNAMYVLLDPQDYADPYGDWVINVYYNDQYVVTQHATVEELTGYLWWTGIIGLLVLLGSVVVVVWLVRRFMQRRSNKKDEVIKTMQDTVYCSNCGGQATWIPEYERWYCYTCQEYL